MTGEAAAKAVGGLKSALKAGQGDLVGHGQPVKRDADRGILAAALRRGAEMRAPEVRRAAPDGQADGAALALTDQRQIAGEPVADLDALEIGMVKAVVGFQRHAAHGRQAGAGQVQPADGGGGAEIGFAPSV